MDSVQKERTQSKPLTTTEIFAVGLNQWPLAREVWC